MTRWIWWILTWARKILKISTLIGSFCATYITFDRKITVELFFMDNEEWCNIWRITDLWFGKWHEKYDRALKSHQSAQKPQNWDLRDSFIQCRKYMSLQFTGELCGMTMKNDAKFVEELTCRFKIDTTTWHPKTQMSQKSAL